MKTTLLLLIATGLVQQAGELTPDKPLSCEYQDCSGRTTLFLPYPYPTYREQDFEAARQTRQITDGGGHFHTEYVEVPLEAPNFIGNCDSIFNPAPTLPEIVRHWTEER
jgi:hypothetical protein